MKDVQGELDRRNIPLKHVGIKDLRWPIALKDKEKGTQNTVATVSLAVDLPHDLRGTHMSRFVGCLQTLGPDRKSTRLNSSHIEESRMPSSA